MGKPALGPPSRLLFNWIGQTLVSLGEGSKRFILLGNDPFFANSFTVPTVRKK